MGKKSKAQPRAPKSQAIPAIKPLTEFDDTRILALAYDADKYHNALDYCNVYLILRGIDRISDEEAAVMQNFHASVATDPATSDPLKKRYTTQEILNDPEISKFYIKDLEAELVRISKAKIIESEDEDSITYVNIKYFIERLRKFFNLNKTPGIRHYVSRYKQNDIAHASFFSDAEKAIKYLRSFDSMYAYCPDFKKIVDLIATKVRDISGQYDNLTKMKYAHIYYRYFYNYQFMDGDDKRIEESKNGIPSTPQYVLSNFSNKFMFLEDGKLSPDFTMYETHFHLLPTRMMLKAEWEDFFKYLPDNDIILDLVHFLMFNQNSSIEVMMHQDSQLGKYANRSQIINYYFVRISKELIFPYGAWTSDFCRVNSLNSLSAAQIRDRIRVWKQYVETFEWESENKEKFSVLIPTNGTIEFEVPCFGKNKKARFVDPMEVLAFTNMITYFQKFEPDFVFHGKAFKDYQFLCD